MRRNADPRTHYYISRCTECPEWIEHCPQSPIRADRVARKHARKLTGHATYVIDLTALSVVYRYRFDALPVLTEPPF